MIVLMRDGKKVGERLEGSTRRSPPRSRSRSPFTTSPQPSRVMPGLAFGLGSAALVAGAVLYFTSEKDDGTQLYYRDTRLLGAGVAVGGVS